MICGVRQAGFCQRKPAREPADDVGACRQFVVKEPGVRTAAFSLSYSIAAALFGGFTPAVSTYLIHQTHNQAMPGLWLSLAAGLGLIAALSRTRKLDES